ncbi:MAG: esterase [Planctomycetes bacterium]|nr:esterase [Planctomycetota bacterium]
MITVLLLACLQDEKTLDHSGQTRTYRLHMSKNATGPLPLVVALHGAMSSGRQMQALTKFDALADEKGFAVVYPDGLKRIWRFAESDTDVGFLTALIDHLIEKGIADTSRIYVTGISNGALMAHRLACDRADRIAACATVAGTTMPALLEKLKPSKPVPLLYIHGTDDPVLGYDGTDRFTKRRMSLGAEEFVAWWAKKNGCGEKPEVEALPDRADDGTTVERRTYGGGAPVVFYRIAGGGHTWPGGPGTENRILGRTCKDLDASAAMWEFFAKYRR